MFECDFVRHLEAETKVVGHRIAQSLEGFFRGELVIARVDTDGLEGLRVFGETVFLKAFLADLAAMEIALFVVEKSEPALVFPRRSADVHSLLRQRRNATAHGIQIKIRT